MIERACALADGDTVDRSDLPDHVLEGVRLRREVAQRRLAVEGAPLVGRLSLREAKERWVGALEATYLKALLGRHGGNVSAAARDADVDRKTFHRLLKKHRIVRGAEADDDLEARAS